jgi:hypothetical protein
VTSRKSFAYYRTAKRPDIRKITDAVDALDEDMIRSGRARDAFPQRPPYIPGKAIIRTGVVVMPTVRVGSRRPGS